MRQNRCSTPLGTKDLLLEECFVRREVENTLSALFMSRGFSEVMTPGMEYLDVFLGEKPAVPVENMYKMTDCKGRLLVMRPDSTLPIARLAATRLSHGALPLRFYYAQDVYHMNVGLTGRADQEFQAGVELIGASGERADIEIISLAAQALKAVVGDGFRIEIGHVGFFESLMDELDADTSTEEEIRMLIEGKNYAALGDLLDRLPASGAVDALRTLPRLFGGEDVLEKAKPLCRNGQGQSALACLASLYEALRQLVPEEQIMIDLGMLHRNEYYTGVIFRGYVEGSGDVVLSGGRYDALLNQFGAPNAATGFAINVDSITKLLQRRGAVQPLKPCKVLVHALKGYETKALQRIDALTACGIYAEYSVFDTVQQAKCYAKEKGIAELLLIGETEASEKI